MRGIAKAERMPEVGGGDERGVDGAGQLVAEQAQAHEAGGIAGLDPITHVPRRAQHANHHQRGQQRRPAPAQVDAQCGTALTAQKRDSAGAGDQRRGRWSGLLDARRETGEGDGEGRGDGAAGLARIEGEHHAGKQDRAKREINVRRVQRDAGERQHQGKHRRRQRRTARRAGGAGERADGESVNRPGEQTGQQRPAFVPAEGQGEGVERIPRARVVQHAALEGGAALPLLLARLHRAVLQPLRRHRQLVHLGVVVAARNQRLGEQGDDAGADRDGEQGALGNRPTGYGTQRRVKIGYQGGAAWGASPADDAEDEEPNFCGDQGSFPEHAAPSETDDDQGLDHDPGDENGEESGSACARAQA